MKHTLIILMFIMALPALAQNGNGDKVRQLKIEFIAERLNLSPDQSLKFWPIYDKYENEVRDLRREVKSTYIKNGGNENDKIAMVNYIYNSATFINNRQSIRNKYKPAMLSVLSTNQLSLFMKAEDDFRDQLISQLKSK